MQGEYLPKRDFVAALRYLGAPCRGGAFIQVADELRSCAVYIVGLVKHLNGTRETYDARMRLFNDKLDIIFEKLNTQAATAKKPAFPTRPKRLRDLPAFLFRDIPIYFLRRI